jgi:hypothetical protein
MPTEKSLWSNAYEAAHKRPSLVVRGGLQVARPRKVENTETRKTVIVEFTLILQRCLKNVHSARKPQERAFCPAAIENRAEQQKSEAHRCRFHNRVAQRSARGNIYTSASQIPNEAFLGLSPCMRNFHGPLNQRRSNLDDQRPCCFREVFRRLNIQP